MRRRFFVWATVLATVWLLANWPRDGGTLKFWMEWAGCPWTFAFWEDGRPKSFDAVAFAADVGVLALLAAVAWLCAWSYTFKSRSGS